MWPSTLVSGMRGIWDHRFWNLSCPHTWAKCPMGVRDCPNSPSLSSGTPARFW